MSHYFIAVFDLQNPLGETVPEAERAVGWEGFVVMRQVFDGGVK